MSQIFGQSVTNDTSITGWEPFAIIDDFSQRFDKETMQLYHLAKQFIRNPITFTLLLSGSSSINLAPLQDELI